MLAKGVKPNPEGEVRNRASAVFYAAMAGDVPMAKALMEAGASPEQRMAPLRTVREYVAALRRFH